MESYTLKPLTSQSYNRIQSMNVMFNRWSKGHKIPLTSYATPLTHGGQRKPPTGSLFGARFRHLGTSTFEKVLALFGVALFQVTTVF